MTINNMTIFFDLENIYSFLLARLTNIFPTQANSKGSNTFILSGFPFPEKFVFKKINMTIIIITENCIYIIWNIWKFTINFFRIALCNFVSGIIIKIHLILFEKISVPPTVGESCIYIIRDIGPPSRNWVRITLICTI